MHKLTSTCASHLRENLSLIICISSSRFRGLRGEPQQALVLRCWRHRNSFPKITSHHENQSGAEGTSGLSTSQPSQCSSSSLRVERIYCPLDKVMMSWDQDKKKIQGLNNRMWTTAWKLTKSKKHKIFRQTESQKYVWNAVWGVWSSDSLLSPLKWGPSLEYVC